MPDTLLVPRGVNGTAFGQQQFGPCVTTKQSAGHPVPDPSYLSSIASASLTDNLSL